MGLRVALFMAYQLHRMTVVAYIWPRVRGFIVTVCVKCGFVAAVAGGSSMLLLFFLCNGMCGVM